MDFDDFSVLLAEEEQKLLKLPVAPRKFRLGRRELKVFAGNLSRLLAGGVPILRALTVMEKSASNSRFRKFVMSVDQHIKQGMSLKDALEATKAVPFYYSQIIYAGEVSGAIPAVLEDLKAYLEKEERLWRKIREALTYPSFILLMGFVTLGVLLQVVIPKLAGVYEDFGAQLPLITRMVLRISDWFLPVTLTTVMVMSLLVFLFFRRKDVVLRSLYCLPFLGVFLKMCVLAQFSRLFSLLLEKGIVICQALEITGSTFPAFLRREILLIQEGLGEGRSLSSCLEPVQWVDDVSKMLVSAGEESGRTPESFAQIANDTETNLEALVQIMVKMLEPVLILVIGLAVGFIVIGTALPIFDISGLMG